LGKLLVATIPQKNYVEATRLVTNLVAETWRPFVFFVGRLFGWSMRHFNLWNLWTLSYVGKAKPPQSNRKLVERLSM